MANTLRIIYQNLVDLSTTSLSASSTAGTTHINNTKKDIKSLVWRGTGKTNQTITVTFPEAIVGGVLLPFCNLSSTATITVVGTLGGITKINEVNVPACPYAPLGSWDWGALPLGVNSYSYGGGTYARVWVSSGQPPVDTLTITINDPNNTSSYVEVSRLVIGAYWAPKYNTSFGLSTNIKDMSQHIRSDAGDLHTNRGILYNTMNFDLKYLDASDRTSIVSIFKGNGISKPLFISLFPNDADSTKEQVHQIYGKLSQSSDITHPMFGIYSTSIEIEEI